jgi:type I restriction enzyme M protein
MDNQTYNSIVNFIWGIADDCLRDVYVRGKYRDVILPMTVIRRLDGPYPVLDDVGGVRIPALDNHTMGVIFEKLIRRFNEENNEEAGEHFTPRDVVELMADLVFTPISDKIMDASYSCYDGASGTGGMLTVSQERLLELAKKSGKTVSINLYGQEINPETYAISCADMLLKGEGGFVDNIAYGSTIADDRFPSRQFDFMLSNPPYGKSWKNDADKLGGKKGILDTRFVTSFADSAEFSMIPRVSDGQLLFLLNNVAKMRETTEIGSRIAEVHNGSSLFTGDAGQGESNARRYMIERDLVEAIIALPNNMFYNTGIGTFIWLLSNRKEPCRRGKIQLIDATTLKSPLRKNLGQKNCEFTAAIREQILQLYMNFEENEYSKIFDNSAFGYWKVTVLRPQYGEDGKPLYDKKGKLQPNKELTDTEQIPLDHPGGINAFIEAEVLPYAPDAWVDKDKTQIGYEISFTKHFYKPVQLREISEIIADIRALEKETEGLLEEVLSI